MAHQYREIPAAQVPQHVLDGRWDTPAASQGQMVTVSYAADGRYEAGPGARYRRTHDASLAGGLLLPYETQEAEAACVELDSRLPQGNR